MLSRLSHELFRSTHEWGAMQPLSKAAPNTATEQSSPKQVRPGRARAGGGRNAALLSFAQS